MPNVTRYSSFASVAPNDTAASNARRVPLDLPNAALGAIGQLALREWLDAAS